MSEFWDDNFGCWDMDDDQEEQQIYVDLTEETK